MGLLQKIVRNDAMEEDPPEIYGWKVYFLAFSACFGGMLFGVDSGIIGGVLTLPASKTRMALLIAAVIVTIGCVFQAAADGQIALMYVGHLIAGFGVGKASMVTPLYISENAPRAIRGGLTGIYQLFIATGTMLAFWEQLDHERTLIGGASFIDLMKEMWTIPGNRKRAIITIWLMITQQMTGTNAINYYSPQIFQNLGLSSTDAGLFATGIYGVVKMTLCACFLLFAAESLGRRRSLLWTSIAMGCAMLYVGLYVRIKPPVKGADIPGAGYMALVCIYLFAGFFQCGWGPGPWIYVSEIPTARLRGVNVALGAATQWLFNLVVARAVPNMLATMGKAGYGTFLFFSAACFLSFFFAWFFIPETKGLSLEKMDDLFGTTELKKKMDDQEGAHDVPPAKDPEDEKIQHVEVSPVPNDSKR
ncbi:general substrate transporter, partial [Aureobasidium melanogenum]